MITAVSPFAQSYAERRGKNLKSAFKVTAVSIFYIVDFVSFVVLKLIVVKSITICLALIIVSTISFSQSTNNGSPVSKVDYLQKSKHQKTTGLILLGGGIVLEISGVIAYQYGNASILLFGAGLLSQVASIPFFISYGINKRRSKKAVLSFSLEKVPGMQPSLKRFLSSPGIALKISL